MTFFYDLNKKLDEIRATPSKTHGQLNERDMGKHNNATTGFKALAKKAGGGEKGNKIAGAQFQKMKKAGQLEEQTVEESLKDKAKLVGHLAKDMARKGLEKLGHGDDEAMRKDLQKKMGMPQTGKKPGATEDYGPMEAGAPMTAKQKSFAKLAPPADKITFADKIAGAKKEVDERIGDVAAEAIKNALSPKQKKNIDMNKNGEVDANDFAMLRKGGKKQVADEDSTDNAFTAHKRPRVDAPKVGTVDRGHKHDIEHTATGRKVTRRVDDQGHSVGADDASDAEPQKRGRGRPSGTGSKMGAKGPSGKSKLMTKENDRDPGEYDQEGEMAKDGIKTIVRHAQALEKILGDNDNLPEWVQSKLAKIEGMMTAVDDYMQNQQGDEEMAMGEETTRKRDSHAERAGRKVTKDIEYDEKKKDGIHGKKRGSEDAKAEKAGKKVAKDIEYDEKKDKKEDKPKKVKEQGGAETPTASSGFSFGQGIYDSMNRELEKMIAESMSVNMSDSTEGGKSLTITATDEDALKLAGLLKNAGLGGGDQMGQEMGHGDEHGEESCLSCDIDEALAENNPDWPTDTETSDDALQYSGGLNGPKSTGQTTIPVIASQEDRQHTYEDDQALRRMMEMAGLNQTNRLDEGMMDKIKGMLVPKLMKLLGPDADNIANAVKQATGGDLTPSKENAIKVVQALGLDKAAAQGQSPQMAEGIAGNWQGKLIQSLYTLGLLGSVAVTNWAMGPGRGTQLGVASGLITVIGVVLLMFAETFFSSDSGMVGAMGQHGNKGFDTNKGPDSLGENDLKPWEQTMKEAEEKELEESFEQTLNRMRDIAGIKEAKKPDFLDIDKDGDKKEPMAKAAKDKEKKVEESIFALTNQWTAYKG